MAIGDVINPREQDWPVGALVSERVSQDRSIKPGPKMLCGTLLFLALYPEDSEVPESELARTMDARVAGSDFRVTRTAAELARRTGTDSRKVRRYLASL